MGHEDLVRDGASGGLSTVHRSGSDRAFREMIVLHLGVDESEVVSDAKFVNLGVDSLTALELTVAVGDTFGIRVTDEDVAKILTVGEAYSFIESKMGL